MTAQQIEAETIRELLDSARKSDGSSAWDEDAVESEVLELVTGGP